MVSSRLRTMIVALGAAAIVAGAAGGASADEWRREREWREHEWREWCRYHPGAYAYPGYYCPVPAPPPVVYAPPPPAVIYAPPPPVVVYTPPPPPPPPAPALEVVVPIRIK